MKRQSNFEAIYHELSIKYRQRMTCREVCYELGVSAPRYARQLIPSGWTGSGKGLRINTVVFARQLDELQGRLSASAPSQLSEPQL